MSTRPETLDFLLDQLGDWPGLRTRRMFGEYCLYVDDKPVAFVCDDQLYVKPTRDAETLLSGPVVWGRFHDQAKPHLLLTPDRWDDRDMLRALLRATADALPPPKPKKPVGAQRAPSPSQAPRSRPAGAAGSARPPARVRPRTPKT